MTITSQFTPMPMNGTAVEEGRHPGPQRYLDSRLAKAIGAAKDLTGMSWRALAARTGISRAHLNHLSLGKRVPSHRTTEVLISALGLDETVAEELRAASVSTWPHNVEDER
jgi:cyanate lyase